MTIWILSLHKLLVITRIKISSTFQFIYLNLYICICKQKAKKKSGWEVIPSGPRTPVVCPQIKNLTIWILSLHTLITRIKIRSTFQFIYLIWHVFSPVSVKSSVTPSIVPHAFHFMSILLKDRRILLNTVVKWRCLVLHRTWTISKIDFLKFYFRFRMCL